MRDSWSSMVKNKKTNIEKQNRQDMYMFFYDSYDATYAELSNKIQIEMTYVQKQKEKLRNIEQYGHKQKNKKQHDH